MPKLIPVISGNCYPCVLKQLLRKSWLVMLTWGALSREFKTCGVCLAQDELLKNALNYADHANSVTALSKLESPITIH